MERFEQAIMRLQAKAGYKLTSEEIEWDQKQKPKSGTILERDVNYWMRFVDDNGVLNTDQVLSKNYKPEQLPFIQSEMVRLGWL